MHCINAEENHSTWVQYKVLFVAIRWHCTHGLCHIRHHVTWTGINNILLLIGKLLAGANSQVSLAHCCCLPAMVWLSPLHVTWAFFNNRWHHHIVKLLYFILGGVINRPLQLCHFRHYVTLGMLSLTHNSTLNLAVIKLFTIFLLSVYISHSQYLHRFVTWCTLCSCCSE